MGRETNREYIQETLRVVVAIAKGLPTTELSNWIVCNQFIRGLFEVVTFFMGTQGMQCPSCLTTEALDKWLDEGATFRRANENHDDDDVY